MSKKKLSKGDNVTWQSHGNAAEGTVSLARDALARVPYDVVVTNLTYLPAPPHRTFMVSPTNAGPAWAWTARPDGRRVLDPLCRTAPDPLSAGGTMLLAQSEFADADASMNVLQRGDLTATVVAEQCIPFGSVLAGRASRLEPGRLNVGRRQEKLVVIRVDKP